MGKAIVGPSWPLMGRALVGPWALVGRALEGRALVGPLGP